MDAMTATNHVFFAQTGLDPDKVCKIIAKGAKDAEDGELYLERTVSESLAWGDGRMQQNSYDEEQGFGLRFVAGERVGFASAEELSEAALKRACAAAHETVRSAGSGTIITPLSGSVVTPKASSLYAQSNPLDQKLFAYSARDKVELLGKIDSYLRAKDPRVKQVSASLTGEFKMVQIMHPNGSTVADLRPLVRFNVSVVVEQDGRREQGGYGFGGRGDYNMIFNEAAWKRAADEALRQALVNLESVPAPAGEMTVVLGPGWPGVMLHEAVGHGLEGDFNRKGTSAFSGRVGEIVAAPGVTVVDQGNIAGRRGSLNFDDEGTPTQETVLIENGKLMGYMQDRQNARLMGVASTGNGRRESFKYPPIPRMTNTFMRSGAHAPQDIIASVKKGVYGANFGGGSVDITSGKFVFNMSEAYLIEDGKLTASLKGATLIGNGPDAMKKITMIGNDSALDSGIGSCGKGQWVPVGVGQPTLRMDGITVGGTKGPQ